MAGTVNKVTLIGNLGRDPDVKQTNQGTRLANLSIATSEQWTDRQSGERRERTEWHRVVIFNEKLVEVAEKFLTKGSKVYVEGQLQTRKFQDQSGQDRYMTEVVLQPFKSDLQILSGGNQSGGGQDTRSSSSGGSSGGMDNLGSQSSGAPAPPTGGGGGDDLDDEIPFNLVRLLP